MKPQIHCLSLLLAAITPAVAQSQEPLEATSRSVFRGWVLESIGASAEAAREIYAGTAADAAAAREARALALGRLVELEQLHGVREPESGYLEALREVVPDGRPAPDADFDRLRGAFAAALAMPVGPEREAALIRLRAEIAKADAAAPLPVHRAMGMVVRTVQQERTDLVRTLERELDDAQAAGNLPKMMELRRRLRDLSQEPDSRQLLARWMSSWRVRATRLLAQGQIEEAERIRRNFEPDARLQPVPEDPAEALARVAAICDRDDLSAAERSALRELHASLAAAVRGDRIDAMRAALRSLPYPLR